LAQVAASGGPARRPRCAPGPPRAMPRSDSPRRFRGGGPQARARLLALSLLALLAAPALEAAVGFAVQPFGSAGQAPSRAAGLASPAVRPARAGAKTALHAAKKKAAPKKKAAAKKEEPAEEPEEAAGFNAGDRVSAKWHEDRQWYPALVLYQKDDDTYDVSFDEPTEPEQISSVQEIKLIKRGDKGAEEMHEVPLKVGDLVWGWWMDERKWYNAKLEGIEKDGKLKIRWDEHEPDEPEVEVKPRHEVKLRKRKW